jgi:hypothetical protein
MNAMSEIIPTAYFNGSNSYIHSIYFEAEATFTKIYFSTSVKGAINII